MTNPNAAARAGGTSLGHADPAAVEHTLVTEREPVQGFTRFHD